MLFSVIYSADVPEDTDLSDYLPSEIDLFDVTEDYSGETYKDGFDTYSYLGELWEKGSHKKLCAVLTREQFEQFIKDTGLSCDSTETMGSIGAPGLGYGVSPAICFNGDHYDCISQAYVTPIPEYEYKTGISTREESFYRIKLAMLDLWGN